MQIAKLCLLLFQVVDLNEPAGWIVIPLKDINERLVRSGNDGGKVMSHRANKLQMPFLANSIYISDRFLERSINSCDNQINS